MKIMSWNCRGTANQEFKQNAIDIINQHNPGILVIMETKLVGEKAKEAVEALRFPKKVIVDSDGLVGGIWLLWDDMKYTVDILNAGSQVIHANV
ncbi:hypothetical protein SLA2020_498390 [Shorea laevis]